MNTSKSSLQLLWLNLFFKGTNAIHEHSTLTIKSPPNGITGLFFNMWIWWSFPVHHQLPDIAQTHVHRVCDAIQPFHPLSSPSPCAFNLSQKQRIFQWVSSLHQVARVLEFQLQHQSFHEYSGLISFSVDWLDLLVVQENLKSLLQHHNSNASTLQQSPFFIVQLSHSYMIAGKPQLWLDRLLLVK